METVFRLLAGDAKMTSKGALILFAFAAALNMAGDVILPPVSVGVVETFWGPK